MTTVGPSPAYRPARSTHDFTWADATGSVYRIGCSAAPPTISSGGQPSVSTIEAPIWRSGIATRSTGRRRIDSSPSSVNVPSWPARMPTSSRSSVPALPTSIGPSGAWRPRSPTPCTRSRVGPSSSCSTRAELLDRRDGREGVCARRRTRPPRRHRRRGPRAGRRGARRTCRPAATPRTSALAGATRRTSSSSVTRRRRRRAASRSPSTPVPRAARRSRGRPRARPPRWRSSRRDRV